MQHRVSSLMIDFNLTKIITSYVNVRELYTLRDE
jgi:glutaredoxin-related protein